MTATELVAVLAGPAPTALPEGTQAVAAGDFTAILAERPRQFGKGRKAMLRHAHRRQALLEALMPAGPVIPALTGTPLRDAQAPLMLEANAELLSALAARLAGRVQFQVHVSWRAGDAARHFGHDGPLERLQNSVSDRIAAALATVAEDMLALPLRDSLIANHAVLIRDTAIPALDTAVEAIDAIWTEGFSIRQIGPSPAVSFASLGLKRVPGRVIAGARHLLDLGPEAGPQDIRTARRTRLMAAEDSGREAIREAARILETVQRCPGAASGFPMAFTWSEGRAASFEPERSAA